jgi:predicted HicB family RNase H-like nuclease
MGRINIVIPDELHKELKIMSAKTTKTLSELIILSIQDFLKK